MILKIMGVSLMEKMNNVFPERIRALRMKKGWTMQHLADQMGKGKSTIAGYEAGQRNPKAKDLDLIAKLLDTNVEYLVGSSDDPTPKTEDKNLAVILKNTSDYNYNGIPLSKKDLELLNLFLEKLIDEVDEHSATKEINTRSAFK